MKLGVGMVAAMTSLILGLMTASVKQNFDSTDKDVHTYALSILSLEADLRHAGPDGCEAQRQLLDYTRAVLVENWTDTKGLPPVTDNRPSGDILLTLDTLVRTWAPTTDLMKEVRTAAIADTAVDPHHPLGGERRSGGERPRSVHSGAYCLLTLIFISFGLFAPQNAIVSIFFFMCALSIGGALFLILEMSGPFDGIISVSPQPLIRALNFIQMQACKG